MKRLCNDEIFYEVGHLFPIWVCKWPKYENGQTGTNKVPFALQILNDILQNLCSMLGHKANLTRCFSRP